MSNYYYCKCENKANLLLAFSQVIGPFHGVSEKDWEKEILGAYFDPVEKTGICILSCSNDDDSKDGWKKEIEKAKTPENADKIEKLKDGVDNNTTFIIDCFGDESFIRERIEEVVSITYGVRICDDNAEFISKKVIPDNVTNYQTLMVKKCSKVFEDVPAIVEVANMENPKKRQVNIAYSLAMYIGFTNGRKLISIPALKCNQELLSILATINTWYIKKYPDFYIRADHMGDRIKTMDFITWCFGNGACSLRHIIAAYDTFEKAYSNMLSSDNYNIEKHLKGVKEMLVTIDEMK